VHSLKASFESWQIDGNPDAASKPAPELKLWPGATDIIGLFVLAKVACNLKMSPKYWASFSYAPSA